MQVRFLQGLRNTGLAQLVVALVSKTRGRRFESFNPCKLLMELWCRWLFARWTENPEALVRLKVAPQICSYNSFMNCYFKFIICSYSTTVSASVFQTEDASSILVSCSNLGRVNGWYMYARLKIWRSCFYYKSTH